MNPFLEGSILGLTLSVLLGPALFALIQTSIQHGFRSGAFLAIGIFFSDLTLVVLCFLGALQMISNEYNRLVFGIISGLILIGYGVVNFIKTVNLDANGEAPQDKKPGWPTFILKGYFLNIANPFVWIFWMGVTVGVTSNYGDHTQHSMLFFSGVLFTIFATDIIKVLVAKLIKGSLTIKLIKRLNYGVGVVLILIGLYLILRAILSYYGYFSEFS